MVIQLRNGMIINVETAKKIIERYYQCMGKGVHAYDESKLPADNSFPEDQIRQAIKLVNRLGGRGIPQKSVELLIQRRHDIELQLRQMPINVAILDSYEDIPWSELKTLFDIFRIKYISIPRLTKVLHKNGQT
ncbi:MAG: hypothetical protein MUO97_04860 [Dehalococcoidia bacterium]|nr:hypothetical protein [Dehalococcoidia bacterium]